MCKAPMAEVGKAKLPPISEIGAKECQFFTFQTSCRIDDTLTLHSELLG